MVNYTAFSRSFIKTAKEEKKKKKGRLLRDISIGTAGAAAGTVGGAGLVAGAIDYKLKAMAEAFNKGQYFL